MVVVVILAVAVEVAAEPIVIVAGIPVMMKTRSYRRTQSLSPICLIKQQRMLLRIILDKLV